MRNGSKCRLFAELPMKTSRGIAVIAFREIRRFATITAERAAQIDRAKMPRSTSSLRPLSEAETEAILGGELLAALSGVRRHV